MQTSTSPKMNKSTIPWAFVLLLLISCALGHASSTQEQAEPPTPKRETSKTTAQDLAQRVAQAIGNQQIFKVTPADVSERLSKLAQIQKTVATEYLLQFSGADRDSGINWVIAQFQPSVPGSREPWQLLQIRMGITPPDRNVPDLFRALKTELSKRLSKPRRTSSGASNKEMVWLVAPHCEIRVREGKHSNPLTREKEQGILVEAAVLQGEAD